MSWTIPGRILGVTGVLEPRAPPDLRSSDLDLALAALGSTGVEAALVLSNGGMDGLTGVPGACSTANRAGILGPGGSTPLIRVFIGGGLIGPYG